MSRKWFWAFAVVLLLVAAPVFGASQNAALYGTVYDASGNPMPGVTVTLENPALAFSRTATSGSDGAFNFAEVPPAENYRLTASKGGKKLDIRTGLSVNVGDERVILPPLREQAVAASAQAVEKTAERSVTNESASTAISGVITGEQLLSLPLYNRNFLALGLLTPNTHAVEANNTLVGASFSVAGNRANNNNFLLDGVDNVASNNNQSLPFQVNDSIQEFRVTSSNPSAEYGRNQGGTVNVVTRRAGNGFHGNVFGYFGSDQLNADNPLSLYNGGTFDKAHSYAGSQTPSVLPRLATPWSSGFGGLGAAAPTNYNDYVATAAAAGFCTNSITPATGTFACTTGGRGERTLFNPAAILATHNRFKQPFSSQQFGVNLGGALVKNKFFVFASYEGTRIDNPNAVLERVPSTFDKTYNPLLTAGVPGANSYLFTNTDPSYVLGQKVLALFPKSNVIGVPGVLEFFQGETPNFTHVHNGLFRADLVQSDKSSWTFRYAVQGLHQLHDDTLPATGSYPGNGAIRDGLNQNAKVSFNHAFSSSLLNELRFGVTRFNVSEAAQDASFNATTIGLPSKALMTFLLSGLDPQYSGGHRNVGGAYQGWTDSFRSGNCCPTLPTLDGLFPFARIGAPLTAPSNRRDTTWFVGDGVSWSRGRHAVKFGAELQSLDNHVGNSAFSRGYVVSSDIGEFTSDSEQAGSGFSNVNGFRGGNYFAPAFDYALRQSAPYEGKFHSWAFSSYLQDTWRIHPRWSLNYGIRYEFYSVPKERNDQLWNFDPVANGLVQAGHVGVVDQFGNTCAASANYDVLPNDTNFSNGWTCKVAGSGKFMQSDKNNFSPRVGLAWDVRGNGKTVIRGGYGIFYDHLPISYLSPLQFNRPTPKVLNNPQLIYGTDEGFGGFAGSGLGNAALDPAVIAAGSPADISAASPFAIYAWDFKHSRTPYSHQFNATVQQQITGKLVAEVGYVGNLGRNLPVMTNTGFINQWFCTSSAPFCDNNSFSPYFTMADRGSSSYHSLMARARIAGWHGFRANATYVWSKSIDNASNGFFPTLPITLFNSAEAISQSFENPQGLCLIQGVNCGGGATGAVGENPALTTTGLRAVLTTPYNIPQDPVNFLKNDRGPSDFNSKHRFVLDYTWEVPGKQSSTLRGHWTVSGIFVAQSGQPFTIFSGPLFGELTQRVNLLGAVTQHNNNPNNAISTTNLQLASIPCTLATGTFAIASGSAFSGVAGTACTGNSGRNRFTGPNFASFDFAIQKGFAIGGEHRLLSLRAEFYNISNRANFYNPNSTLSLDAININPDFGKIKSAHDPRQIQFGARFSW